MWRGMDDVDMKRKGHMCILAQNWLLGIYDEKAQLERLKR